MGWCGAGRRPAVAAWQVGDLPHPRHEILTRWPSPATPPTSNTLWRWLSRACELGGLARYGSGSKVDAFQHGVVWGRPPTCRCCLAGRRPAPPTPRNPDPLAQPGDAPDAQHLMALVQPRLRSGRARSPRLGEQDGCVSVWVDDERW